MADQDPHLARPDGHWKVEGISVDTDGHGFQPRFRVWHDDIERDGTLLLQQDREPDYHPARGNSRTGSAPVRAGGWVLAESCGPRPKLSSSSPGTTEEACPVIPLRPNRNAA